MKVFKTEVRLQHSRKVLDYSFCGISFFRKEWSFDYRSTYLFNVRISHRKISDDILNTLPFDERIDEWIAIASKAELKNFDSADLFVWPKKNADYKEENIQEQNNHLFSLNFIRKLFYLNTTVSDTEIIFDHDWGGGTETYIMRKISAEKDKKLFVRVCGKKGDYIKVSYYYADTVSSIVYLTNDAIKLLSCLRCSEITVNNLASYINPLAILDEIKLLKEKTGAFLSVKGHDFQAICPNINLLNYKGEYCHPDDLSSCLECFCRFTKTLIPVSSVHVWQEKWHSFLKNTADELVVFSNSSFDIFSRVYDDISEKIKIIPHTVPPMRMVSVSTHKSINIAVLGKITNLKGAKIVKDIDRIIKDFPGMNLYVVGTCKGRLSNIKVSGRYNPSDLPDILEKIECDVVFIPSIWPETFSYTTAEAMAMGLPVACFDLGAPAERVKKYEKGIIVPKISAASALNTIKGFFENRI